MLILAETYLQTLISPERVQLLGVIVVSAQLLHDLAKLLVLPLSSLQLSAQSLVLAPHFVSG